MASYSFADVNASITGPGPAGISNVSLSSESGSAGIADEGIVVEPVYDDNTQEFGADGFVQNNKAAGSPATVTVNLLKTSPVNKMLNKMYLTQRASGVKNDLNLITITYIDTGETHTLEGVAFKRRSSAKFSKDGGMNAWTFDASRYAQIFGDYT